MNKISLIILTLLIAQSLSAQAQDRRGFSPPGTSFGSNPFAGKAGGDKAADDDEEDTEEMDDISEEILRQRMEQRLREKSSPSAQAPNSNMPKTIQPPNPAGNEVDFGDASNDMGATSISGGANSKITSKKGNGCLTLDPYTGYGPDIVTNFDFPDADIVEIAKTLSRLTCLNLILDKDVKGRISVVSNSTITVGDAWKAFLTALDVNGFTLIPSGKYLRIARQRDAKDKQIKTYSGDFSPDNDLYITRVLPLKYINAEEVARVFRNFMPPNTRIFSYDQTNTIIMTDTASNIKKLVDMIQLLDVEGYDEGLEVIRIKYASAQDIAKLIDQLLPGSGSSSGGNAPSGVPRFRGAGFSARKTKEGGVISHIIPDDRTNAVIVSANAKGLEQVKELILKLDQKVSANASGSRIRVLYLQYADADQVAQTLNNLASGSGGNVKPIAQAGASATATLFEGSIKVAADKPTNSIVVTGTPTDFETVKRVLAKLDVPRDQVYVEAILMEMTLDKNFELGTSIALPTSGVGFLPNQDFGNFLANPFSLSGLVMGFKSGTGTRSISVGSQTISVDSVQGLVKALQRNTNSNVLATPQILTLDNQEATIEIGDNIPYQTSTAVQGAVSTNVSFLKASLKLKLKPQINKISNFVKLDIDQKLSDVKPSSNSAPGQPPATFERESKTTVVVQDGDTVALGGLIRNNITEETTKVPLLGDIPVLGWLFRSKITRSAKQNLLAFITPQIIKQYQSMRKILDKKIRQRDEFIERNAGGDDPFEEQKVEMIKNLPPLNELKSGGRVENPDNDDQIEEFNEPPAKVVEPKSASEPGEKNK